MSWRRLLSRCELPTAPRKYFVVTMFAALMLHSAGNSTPRCSKLIEPSRQLVMTTSRRSQTTSSYGCTPAVVKTRLTLRPLPRFGALPARRGRGPARRSSVSVMTWSSPWSWAAAGEEPRIDGALTGVAGGTDSSSGGGGAAGAAAAGRREVGLHARQWRGASGKVPGPQLTDLLLEVLERVERAVDAGEAQVRDLVELAQRAQDRQPHLVAGHLGHPGSPDGVLDLLGQLLELVLVDRTPLAGPPDAGDDLGPVERLAHPAALDDGQDRLLDRGEPALARRAGPPPAGGRALVGLARIDDPAVGVVAEGTPHRRSPPFRGCARRRRAAPARGRVSPVRATVCGPSWGHPVDVPGRTWGPPVHWPTPV